MKSSASYILYCIPFNWASGYRISNIFMNFSTTLTAVIFECAKGIIYSPSWYFCDIKLFYFHLIDREVRSVYTAFKWLLPFEMPNSRWPDLLDILLHRSIIYPKQNFCANSITHVGKQYFWESDMKSLWRLKMTSIWKSSSRTFSWRWG